MYKKIIVVTETGSDLTPALAEEHGIHLVPMHVSLGDKTLDDGTFPAEDVCKFYEETGEAPHTSGSTPEDFMKAFDDIHAAHPDAHILYLAYSAVTTCSYHSAQLAAEGRDYVTSVDTKHVSVGLGVVVMTVADWVKEHPDASVEEAAEFAKQVAENCKMCFIPKNLDYLRAGGRVSNVVALTGNLLNLHPCIEILDGKLMAKKKYRGKFEKVIPKLLEEYAEANALSKEELTLIDTPYFEASLKALAEQSAKDLGFQSIRWLRTGCVITCHGGPGAFGIVGFNK